MGENSKIEWCHHTMNFWIGCTAVSPACDHCYAQELAERYGWAKWGAGQPRYRTKDWAKPIAWNRKAAKLGIRYRVFSNSLSDWADKEVPDAWRDDAMKVIEATPNLDWLLLTKRPKVMREYFERRGSVPDNVWAGTTAEDSKMAALRIPDILQVKARVHWISAEPLLEGFDLANLKLDPALHFNALTGEVTHLLGFKERTFGKVNLVIVGGESGKDARPMHPDWARSLRDQCQAAGASFFFKQWGSCLPGNMDGEDERGRAAYEIDEEHSSIDYDVLGRGRLVEAHGYSFIKFPHKNTGRLPDGRTWDEVPA